jgi:hypothetical protein
MLELIGSFGVLELMEFWDVGIDGILGYWN